MGSKYWIKLYHEVLDDPKMGRLPDRLWRRTVELFLMAGDNDEGGYLPDTEDIAWRLRSNIEEVETELDELKAKNEEYKEALKVFRNKLNEIAVFNSNLAYATKLFMEHSTTKAEKMDILKRFDNVSTIKESKSLYKSIEGEMTTKSPVTESIEKTIKAPKAGAVIKEDTAYVDPQVARMKLLMEKLG